MEYMNATEYYSVVEEWNNANGSNTDGPREYSSQWSKSHRERQTLYDITDMWNLKKIQQMNLYSK